jgi:uncharacterized protein (DUF924 family)
MDERDAVLEFWFPDGFGDDLETHREQWTWRMRGGADVAIVERFSELCEQAGRGKLDSWPRPPAAGSLSSSRDWPTATTAPSGPRGRRRSS